MVHGCVSFCTEADSDDGLPHTLEHLVFMGSQKYPFKGVLDLIANRCMASGTNAWTDQDHTAYTLDTVGSEGFLMVLPIYIDHLLQPMLTTSQFATEVHHINGNGENAGVVYSEMQDHESEMENIVDVKLKELLFPPAHPYRVDTGGKLAFLRDSCSLQKVQDYHKRYYHLSNMLVSVCGQVPHQKLLSIMEKVEEEYLPRVPSDFTAPFQMTAPELTDFKEEQVECPSDDASRGIVEIAWFTHDPNDLETCEAILILADYFTRTAVAPMQKDFVLLEEPLASGIDMIANEEVKCRLTISFQGVPVEKLKECKAKLMSKTVPEYIKPESWDMDRMNSILDQEILNEQVKLETRVHKSLFGEIISHQLYDHGQEKLLVKRLNKVDTLQKLKAKPAEYWAQLVQTYLTGPSATVIGLPSEALVEKVAKTEKARLNAQRKALGKKGLEEKKNEIEQAIWENTHKKPDADLLKKMIVEKLEEFDRFEVKSVSNSDPSSLTEAEAKFLHQFPFHTTIHNCNTQFVEVGFRKKF
ncbi:hypothetical protein WR25_25809 [Diploscapter pachys]|uniref:Peptidase M16 N-terminal domain-containing protein n=1 Tax=Diploscapter pachys TaxID=2018661 RepID=A0A2A2LVV3_9BILA|nr:hypothetical protein WR25_25809 [Diploscapter pachys]